MKNSIIEPIRTYLEEEQTDYCVMITGKWGSGKSFYIKNCLQRDLLDGANKKLIYIPLFGIKTIEDLYLSVSIGISEGFSKKALEKVEKRSDVVKVTADVVKETCEKYIKGINFKGAVLKCINLLPQAEAVKSILSSIMENTNSFNDYCLVFDDFERSKINKIDLLGVFDVLAEQNNAKIIIVSNEERHNVYNEAGKDEDLKLYNEIKEKVIGLQIQFSYGLEGAYNDIVKTVAGQEEVALFMRYRDNILELFKCTESSNIRTFIFAVKRFREIHKVTMDLYEQIKTSVSIDGFLFKLLRNTICSSIAFKEKNIKNCYSDGILSQFLNLRQLVTGKKNENDPLRHSESFIAYQAVDEYLYSLILDNDLLKKHVMQYINEVEADTEYHINILNKALLADNDVESKHGLDEIMSLIDRNAININIYPKIINELFILCRIHYDKSALESLKEKILENALASAEDFNQSEYFPWIEVDEEIINFEEKLKQTLINKKDENKIRNFIECLKKDDGFVDAFSENINSNYLLHVKNEAVFKGVHPEDFVDRIMKLTPHELLRVRSILKNKYEDDAVTDVYAGDNEFFKTICSMLSDEIKQSKKDKIVLYHIDLLFSEMQAILAKFSRE
ncbi:P-loop NTPase fold protein [Phascolarctobacterium succinatutens]|uniref:P-loop NTPase fold protein n=1 Tax=Phascolarctobacterium succinatutens TaxID=626940 RepID=UPI0026EC693D|nr:P-loop NTPase fold protein [Phascolarctobacterium succinatutens]